MRGDKVFQKGNIVKFKKSIYFPEGSKFVVCEEDQGLYILMNTENGAKSGWWKEDELELLDSGSEVFAKALDSIWKKTKTEQKSIKWIKENWNGELELNWNSVLFLYDKIEYNVEIHTVEEFKFYWYVVYPIFKEVFFGSKKVALKETRKAFGIFSKYQDKVKAFYDEVRNE